MQFISKIGSKGEIFPPKQVRELLGLRANQVISIVVRNNGIFISKISNEDEILSKTRNNNVKISYHVLKALDSELENELKLY